MGRSLIKHTEEELIQDKETILSMLKNGIPKRRMQAQLQFSRGYINKICQMLLDEGKITEEQIAESSQKYYAENPNAQGLNKSHVRKPRNTGKAEKRHAKSVQTREKVFELVKSGQSKIEIAEALEITSTAVNLHLKALMEEGRIEEAEIKQADINSRRGRVDKTAEQYISQRNQIVEYLKMGWKNDTIKKTMGIPTYTYHVFLTEIREKKILSPEEIKLARVAKREDDLKFVAECIQLGCTIKQIREMKPEFSYNEVTPMIKELVETGVITHEQVDSNAKAQRVAMMNKNVQLSPKEQVEFITEKVKAGYSPLEIVTSDKTKSLTLHKVLYQKRKIIADGMISQEEADKAMEARKKRQIAQKHIKDTTKLKALIKLGKSLDEICTSMNCTYGYIYKLRDEAIANKKWLSEGDLDIAKENKRAKVQSAREQRELEEISKMRKLAEQGLSNKEIVQNMYYSRDYILNLKKIAISKGLWFSEKELKTFQNKRKLQQLKDKARAEREEQKVARKKAQSFKLLEGEKRFEVKKYSDSYRRLRVKAEYEDRREYEGQEKVRVEGRKMFMEILAKLEKVEANIPEEDIEIVTNALYLHPELATKETIRFLISNAGRTGGIKSAEKMVRELTDSLETTEFYEPLIEYKKNIRKYYEKPNVFGERNR